VELLNLNKKLEIKKKEILSKIKKNIKNIPSSVTIISSDVVWQE
jgi:hypothetical protein